MNHTGLLRQTVLFRHFSDSELADISQSGTLRRLRRHEALAYEGQESKCLFVLLKGSARLYFEGYDGREQVIRVEYAAATLNELGLFDEGLQPFSISACEESIVLCLRISQLQTKFGDTGQPAGDALRLMAGQLRNTLALVRSLSLLDVAQRLGQFLLDYARAHGTAGPDGVHVHLAVSNQEIGEVIGAVREVVSRAMSKLQKNGLIVCSGRALVIPDESRLMHLINRRQRREQLYESIAPVAPG